jgi:hypothetical protein
VDYDDAMAPAAFEDAVVYCVDDLGQYGSVAAASTSSDSPSRSGIWPPSLPESTTCPPGPANVPQHGIAMDDIALSSLVLDRAAAAGVGRYIEFP